MLTQTINYEKSNFRTMKKQQADEPVSMVFETKDYGKFTELKGNRKPNPVHIKSIAESMKQQYLDTTIIVNENYEIIDGQHRFAACKELGYPVQYRICKGYGLSEAQNLNINMKTWGTYDYVKSYAEIGYPEYVKMMGLLQKWSDIPQSIVIAFFTSNSLNIKSKGLYHTNKDKIRKNITISHKISTGEMVIKNQNKIEMFFTDLRKIKTYYERYNQSAFIKAFRKAWEEEVFSTDHFLHKLEYQAAKIRPGGNVDYYKEIIEEIYNHRTKPEQQIRLAYK